MRLALRALRPTALALLATISAGSLAQMTGPVRAAGAATPTVEHSATSDALERLPRKPLDQRIAVGIYAFRSSASQVSAEAATDMFITALVQSGQFRVVERSRLTQGVVIEKQLNGNGFTTGTDAQQKLRGAQYLFEAAVSELKAGESAHQAGINIGGLTLGGGGAKNEIAIDVRILDAATGDILDSVAVHEALSDSSVGVAGTAALAQTLAAMSGRDLNPLTPDVNMQSSHSDSVDRALRSCMEKAVLELVKHIEGTPPK